VSLLLCKTHKEVGRLKELPVLIRRRDGIQPELLYAAADGGTDDSTAELVLPADSDHDADPQERERMMQELRGMM